MALNLREKGWLRMVTVEAGHPKRDRHGYPSVEVEWGLVRPANRDGEAYQWRWNEVPWGMTPIQDDVTYRPVRMSGSGLNIQAGDYNDDRLPSPDDAVRPGFDGGLVKWHIVGDECHPVTDARTDGNWYITTSEWGEIRFLAEDFHEAHTLHRGRRFVKV